MDEEAFLFMKGIKAALCFHSALHSALVLFFPWPLLPCAREEFDKVTPGPSYLLLSPSLIPVLDSNSVSGRSGAALISSARSHLWATLSLSLFISPSFCLVIYFSVEKASEPAVSIQSLTSLGCSTGQSQCDSTTWNDTGGRSLQQEHWAFMSWGLLIWTHPLLLPHCT